METKKAIEKAGSTTALAGILGISVAAVSQWGETIPEQREWQLRVLRPEWFAERHPAIPGSRRSAAESQAA